MWIQQTTLGWVVYEMTGSGSLLALVNTGRFLPSFFIAPFGGVIADRFSRNRVVGITQLALFVNTFLLALALALGVAAFWNLMAFALVIGVANAFNMPARQTMVFDVAPRYAIPNAVALNNLAFSGLRTVGPMVAGWLIVFFGPANNFFLQSVMYLGVLATVWMLRLPPQAAAPVKKSMFSDVVEGYKFVVTSPLARLLLAMSLVPPLFLIPTHMIIIPVYAKDVLSDAGAMGLGIMVSAIGCGGLVGALLTASLNRVDRRGLLQLYALFTFSLAHIGFAVAGALSGNLWLASAFLFLAGAAESINGTTNQTVLQLLAPNEMRGRIAGAMQIQPVGMAFGAMSMGALSDAFGGPTASVMVSLIAFSIALAIMIKSPLMRELRLSRLGQD